MSDLCPTTAKGGPPLVDHRGDLLPLPELLPDQPARRNTVEEREFTKARWGMPPSRQVPSDARKSAPP